MPLGRVGRWGGAAVAHGKRLIHMVVFSMPSNASANATDATITAAKNATAGVHTAPVKNVPTSIGSFAGSGYDVTLIIMVSGVGDGGGVELGAGEGLGEKRSDGE